MNTKIIILAAGKGKRMASELPKVLLRVGGVPMITRLLDAVHEAKITEQPIVVIGHGLDYVCAEIGDRAMCVMQHEQLGTGHAVQVAKESLRGADQIVVLYGDHPFVSPSVIHDVISLREQTKATIAMMTTTVPDFEDWRRVFITFAKIIRDDRGGIIGIREYKDCTPEEKEILEINPGFYCFDGSWLLEHIDKIGNENVQGEFYLTDLIKTAFDEKKKIATLPIPPEEAVGVNSREELEIANQLAKEI
ncbi:MAG: NTP transferase domain-containing protein [Parcubacteria group bacterium]